MQLPTCTRTMCMTELYNINIYREALKSYMHMTTVLSYLKKQFGLSPRLYPPFVWASLESSYELVLLDSSPETSLLYNAISSKISSAGVIHKQVRIQRGGGGGRGSRPHRTPLKNHNHIGFICNTGPDPLKNHKATKPAFNVGPSSARQRSGR